MVSSTDLPTPDEPSTKVNSVPLATELAKPIRWQTHLVLLATAFVSWVTLVIGIALSMRNMFGGPPPDDWGTVFVGLPLLAAIGGIGYFVLSRSRRSEATQSGIQRLTLVPLLLANIFPIGQIVFGMLSYAGGGY